MWQEPGSGEDITILVEVEQAGVTFECGMSAASGQGCF